MEFNRFGSTIPGSYWGCCACDIIQNFNVDPDAKAAIELCEGDGGGSLLKYAGPTYRDIFWQRIRIGTFDSREMANHAFIAIVADFQTKNSTGKKWLAILKEAGFEFIRSVSNSVYTGSTLGGTSKDQHLNHIFMLVRNIASGGASDPFTPPKEWMELPTVIPEGWEYVEDRKRLGEAQRDKHTELWKDQKALAKPLMTEAQALDACGESNTFLSGLRFEYGKQQTRAARQAAREYAGLDKPKQKSLKEMTA